MHRSKDVLPKGIPGWRVLPVLLPLLLSGCLFTPLKDPSKFYALGISDGDKIPAGTAPSPDRAALREEPVVLDFRVTSLPSYLRKAPLMLQRSAHELQFDEFHRWAEPVEEGIARIVLPLLRGALREACRLAPPEAVGADPADGDVPPSPPSPEKTLKLRLALEELKVDLSRQIAVVQGEVTLSLRTRDGVARVHTTPERSWHLALCEKVPDLPGDPAVVWEKVLKAMEEAVRKLGQRLAGLCSRFVAPIAFDSGGGKISSSPADHTHF